jgi:hypothetical protein
VTSRLPIGGPDASTAYRCRLNGAGKPSSPPPRQATQDGSGPAASLGAAQLAMAAAMGGSSGDPDPISVTACGFSRPASTLRVWSGGCRARRVIRSAEVIGAAPMRCCKAPLVLKLGGLRHALPIRQADSVLYTETSVICEALHIRPSVVQHIY